MYRARSLWLLIATVSVAAVMFGSGCERTIGEFESGVIGDPGGTGGTGGTGGAGGGQGSDDFLDQA